MHFWLYIFKQNSFSFFKDCFLLVQYAFCSRLYCYFCYYRVYLFQNPYTLFYCEQWKAENIIFIDEGVSNSYYWWLRKLQRYNRTWWAIPLLQASQPCLRWSISGDFFQNAFLYEFVFCVLFVSQFFLSILFMQPQENDICFPLTEVTSICPFFTMLPATRKKEALFLFFF